MAKKKAAAPKEKPPLVQVAFRGVMATFRLYADQDGRPFVRLPDGRRGYVAARRDGTYLLEA